MRSSMVDIKSDMVSIPTSVLGQQYGVGRVIEFYRNTIKVVWTDVVGIDHIGIYTVLKHQILVHPKEATK